MPRKKHTPEEIVAKLRQADVLVSQGTPVADAIRQIGVTEVTYYRWRQEYGGLKLDQVKRLKELELENARLRKAEIYRLRRRGSNVGSNAMVTAKSSPKRLTMVPSEFPALRR